MDNKMDKQVKPLMARMKKWIYLIITIITLFLLASIFNSWVMNGGDAASLVGSFHTFKNVMLVIQGGGLLLLWSNWEKLILSRVSDKKREHIAKNKNPTCAAAAILLFIMWLT